MNVLRILQSWWRRLSRNPICEECVAETICDVWYHAHGVVVYRYHCPECGKVWSGVI